MSEQVGKPEKKSRYRKIEVRMWGDEKFRKLSAIPPCGQGLWLFLLTGPHTGPIPGLFRSGRAAMAEELDWSTEDFDKAFAEAFEQDMVKADWKAKVVWIPNALKCNKPESPNVVTSWSAEWDLIPECDLKWEAFDSLRAALHDLGEGFGKAFDKAFRKPSGKTSDKATPKTCPNQEQEQEQKEKPLSGEPDDADDDEQEDGDEVQESDSVKEILAHLNARTGSSFRMVESNARLIRARLGEGATVEEAKAVIDAKVKQWAKDKKWSAYLRPKTLFNATNFEQYLAALPKQSTGGSWWASAGFENEWDAMNAGCTQHNARFFKDGMKIKGEQ
jgi:uncharacterized phage protein (TIGR02220 family)